MRCSVLSEQDVCIVVRPNPGEGERQRRGVFREWRCRRIVENAAKELRRELERQGERERLWSRYGVTNHVGFDTLAEATNSTWIP